jgi:riboflavin synthase
MFTGIIEATGVITASETSGTNKTFWISSPVSQELKIDQSVAHSGVCLTVEEIRDGSHRVTAIAETLEKTNLGKWREGDIINIERCLMMNGRLDGHMVQGHVDTTGSCIQLKELDGSWEYTFQFPLQYAGLIVEKGSVALNGISLTVFNVGTDRFSVGIIPYTYEHSNIKSIKEGSTVNLEFDIIGKYVLRNERLKSI